MHTTPRRDRPPQERKAAARAEEGMGAKADRQPLLPVPGAWEHGGSQGVVKGWGVAWIAGIRGNR